MISPNQYLDTITRDSDIISGRDGLICLDRNERYSSFDDKAFTQMLAIQSSSLFSTYPDLGPLYERIGSLEKITSEKIAVGAGSDGLIRRAFQAFLKPGDKVVTPDPSYGMYNVWARIFQASHKAIPYGDGPEFCFDVDELIKEIKTGARICCVANPDQPTGSVLNIESLRKIANVAQKNDTLFLIDEAYYPFHRETTRSLVDEFDNVLVLRTFSKVGGIAGLRVGYAMGNPIVIDALQKVRSPGEVNSVGASIATYLLNNPEITEGFRADVEAGRELLIKTTQKMGFEIPVCAGNFQLLKVPNGVEPDSLIEELKKRGYLIKGGFEHSGLKQYVRVTLDAPSVIEPFIRTLSEAVTFLLATKK